MSVRLDVRTTQLVERMARRSGQTKSEVVREALARYADTESGEAGSAFETWRHLVGSIDTGGAELSRKTGDRFAALVRGKHRARRSG